MRRGAVPAVLTVAATRAAMVVFRARSGAVPCPPRRVVVVRVDGIGDLVLTVPFLRGLRRAFPEAEITLVTAEAATPLLAGCPYVDEVLALDAHAPIPLRALSAAWIGVTKLRGREFDLAVVPRFDVDGRYASVAVALSGAPRRVAFSERATREKQVANRSFDRLFTDTVVDPVTRHEVERGRVLLESIAPVALFDSHLELWLDARDDRNAAELLAPLDRFDGPLAAICPGGSGRRLWPIKRYAEVARTLVNNGCRVVFVGGGGEAAACEAAAGEVGERGLSLAGRIGIRETAAVLARCDLYIGNDTGPMHIATAVGTPAVAISCHPLTARDDHFHAPARFGPADGRSRVLQPSEPLPPCRDTCERAEAHCILGVTTEAVLEAAEALLGAREELPSTRLRARGPGDREAPRAGRSPAGIRPQEEPR